MSWIRPWALATATAVVSYLLSGCTEGYSGKGDTLHLSYGMSQQASLDAMNHIGQAKHRPYRTLFVLLDGCVLEIQTLDGFKRKTTLRVPLREAKSTVERDIGSQSYRVQIAPKQVHGKSHTLLNGASWTDAAQMRWLLDYVQTVC